jgi:hypothetical protein
MSFEIPQFPSRDQVGYLDPEVAGEGAKVLNDGTRVLLSDGSIGEVSILPPKTVMPDWSKLKPIAKYFAPRQFTVWPAWLYHPTQEARIVRNGDEAGALGITFRKTTNDERGRFGVSYMWDWKEGCDWRPAPWSEARKFDAKTPDHGKIYVAAGVDPMVQQHALLRELLPAIAGTIAKELQASGPKAPANVSEGDWAEFLKFKAWQKTQEAVAELETRETAAPQPDEEIVTGEPVNALAGASDDGAEDRDHWESEAERIGLKVDRRWSLDTLKAKIAEAASDKAA